MTVHAKLRHVQIFTKPSSRTSPPPVHSVTMHFKDKTEGNNNYFIQDRYFFFVKMNYYDTFHIH